MLNTLTLSDHADDIAQAAALLQAGALVAFPTETVYGLGGDAGNDQAVAGIYAAKGRPQFNPLIVHLADLEQVEEIAHLSPRARAVAERFWPGPLTLVLPLKQGARVSPLVSAGLETVAIRLPAHPLAQSLLRAFGRGLAGPSANPSGRVSPTTAEHVRQGLDGRIAAVLDGGPCAVGLESTILAFDASGAPVMLRQGGLAQEDIEATLGCEVLRAGHEGGDRPSAPGQLLSHYAPEAPVRLEVAGPQEGMLWVGFGDSEGAELNLSPRGDLVEAAAALFAMMRQADALAAGRVIGFAPIPERGLGRAINDRLRRAAAPRDQPEALSGS